MRATGRTLPNELSGSLCNIEDRVNHELRVLLLDRVTGMAHHLLRARGLRTSQPLWSETAEGSCDTVDITPSFCRFDAPAPSASGHRRKPGEAFL
jgi:hypothetical protein